MLVPAMSQSLVYPVAQRDARMAHLAIHESRPANLAKPRLLDRVREEIRSRHYSRRTEKAYVAWIRRYIFFHGKRHPLEMGGPEVSKFLTSLAVDGQVSASTQNQALSGLLFPFYLDPATRQRRRHHLHESVLQRVVKEAVRRAGIPKRATVAYAAALVRDPPARSGSRYSNRPGASGPPRREHNPDLYARSQSGPGRRPQPRRSARPVNPTFGIRLRGRSDILGLPVTSGGIARTPANAVPGNDFPHATMDRASLLSCTARTVRRATQFPDTDSSPDMRPGPLHHPC
jgi:integrase-like protein